MGTVEKYLGEGKPSLDSLKYDPSKFEDIKNLADDMVKMAKKGLIKGMQKDIMVNIAWAIKKGDKQKVKKLIEKYPQYILGGQSTLNQILAWIG